MSSGNFKGRCITSIAGLTLRLSRVAKRSRLEPLVRPHRRIKMTREEAIAELIECQNNLDTEATHGIADEVLCRLLDALGYGDVVAEYDKVDKWFA